MKKIIYLVAAFLCLSCSDDHESNPQNGGTSGSVTEVTPVTSDLCVELTTDKAFYKPNETVTFTAADALPAGTKVRYRLSGEIVGEEPVSGTNWTWKAPSTDFKGYMAELYRQENGTGRHRRYDCGRCIQPSGTFPPIWLRGRFRRRQDRRENAGRDGLSEPPSHQLGTVSGLAQ